jgi:hypothetical protein
LSEGGGPLPFPRLLPYVVGQRPGIWIANEDEALKIVNRSSVWLKFALICALGTLIHYCGGCSTIRVTDPAATATQLFLESEATRQAVQQINVSHMRDRKVFVDATYLSTIRENSEVLSFKQTPQPYLFLVAELRARLLLGGARLVEKKEEAEVIVEARTGGISVDHEETLLGLASITIPTEVVATVPFTTPELGILKSTKQFGYASVAIVAYWRDTGEVVSSSGPFVGRTNRFDYWILGMDAGTVGNIPPAQKAPPPNAKATARPR